MELPERKGQKRDGRRRHYQGLQNHDGRGENRTHEEGLVFPMPKEGTPQPRLSREEGKGHDFTIDGYHPRSDPHYPEKDDGKGTHGDMTC